MSNFDGTFDTLISGENSGRWSVRRNLENRLVQIVAETPEDGAIVGTMDPDRAEQMGIALVAAARSARRDEAETVETSLLDLPGPPTASISVISSSR